MGVVGALMAVAAAWDMRATLLSWYLRSAERPLLMLTSTCCVG